MTPWSSGRWHDGDLTESAIEREVTDVDSVPTDPEEILIA
jgi:hypothetical protein